LANAVQKPKNEKTGGTTKGSNETKPPRKTEKSDADGNEEQIGPKKTSRNQNCSGKNRKSNERSARKKAEEQGWGKGRISHPEGTALLFSHDGAWFRGERMGIKKKRRKRIIDQMGDRRG